MRAEAHRHFNGAAIQATILRNQPSVVSAVADPISKIDNLTILSTDGASEIVRTATSNLTQAGYAIKGLTGIDVPQVFAKALENSSLTGGNAERALQPRDAPGHAGAADRYRRADSRGGRSGHRRSSGGRVGTVGRRGPSHSCS